MTQAEGTCTLQCTKKHFELGSEPRQRNEGMPKTCEQMHPASQRFSQAMTHQAGHSAACACIPPPPEQVLD